MKRLLLSATLVLVAAAIAACGGGPRMDVAAMTAAQPADLSMAGFAPSQAGPYRIGAGDKLAVRVFQVPDLSFDEQVVDMSGNIQMPLIGAVRAQGLSATELGNELERQLGVRYLRNPQVTVLVAEAASQKITLDGAVTKPGVYELRGDTSLLQAVAMAEGPTRVADLSKVAVFRTIDGQRAVAVFDLGAIRNGQAEDPRVLGNDIVVVDTSRLNSVMRDVVAALPALAIFRAY